MFLLLIERRKFLKRKKLDIRMPARDLLVHLKMVNPSLLSKVKICEKLVESQ